MSAFVADGPSQFTDTSEVTAKKEWEGWPGGCLRWAYVATRRKFMEDLTLLNPELGTQLRWTPPHDFSFFKRCGLLPVEAEEAGKLAASLPLAVIKEDSQPSGWGIVAVCGRTTDT